jgi:transcriptional regulator with XRE-family HTH domain
MERTKLAAARYEEGWSQEEVAERVGVTRNTFSKWERESSLLILFMCIDSVKFMESLHRS